MTTLHATSPFNVEASLNSWFQTQINAITKPSWLPTLAIIYNLPEAGIITPGISVFHIPISVRALWQGARVGGGKGGRAAALMDVSCWVSRGDSPHWNAQLMTLGSMVEGIFAGGHSLQLSNYLTDPANPVAVAFKVDVSTLEYASTMHDPNPDIERVRYLVRYDWTLRRVS